MILLHRGAQSEGSDDVADVLRLRASEDVYLRRTRLRIYNTGRIKKKKGRKFTISPRNVRRLPRVLQIMSRAILISAREL